MDDSSKSDALLDNAAARMRMSRSPPPNTLATARSPSDEEPYSRTLLWIFAALLLHVAGTMGATVSLSEQRGISREMRAAIRDQLEQKVTIEPTPLAPAPEPEIEPTPEPPPPPVAPKPKDDPYELPPKEMDPYEMPPAPAEAAKVLTTEASPAEKPADTFATGESNGPGFGMVAGSGSGNSPTFSRHAVVGGVPGGRGTRMPVKPPPDLSRPPSLLPDGNGECKFPAKADSEGLMGAVVRFIVTVGPDGTAQAVRLVADPGHGFGTEAYRCAMRGRYRPARDAAGRATTATLGPIGIRFTR